MDRVEIKSLAKEKIKGNLWTIWWPLLVVSLISGVAGAIGGYLTEAIPMIGAIINCVFSIAAGVLGAAYTAYLMAFVRGENPDFNTVIECFKSKWVKLLITSILVALLVFLWSLLLIIPGIIKSFAYSMALLIVIDTDLSANDAIEESMKMMDGYKLDYFVFQLSFIGWMLLGCITLGIVYIWVFPYMSVAEIIYYDKLKEKYYGRNKVSTEPKVESNYQQETIEEKVETSAPSLEDTKIGGEEDSDPIQNK